MVTGPADQKIKDACRRSIERLNKLNKFAKIKSGDHPRVACLILDKNGNILRDSKSQEIFTLTDATGSNNGRHAEAEAILRMRNDEAFEELFRRSHTLVTTLEPCSFRNTDKHAEEVACAKLIRYAGIKQVVVGALDPAPEIRGRGLNIIESGAISFSMFPAELQDDYREKNRKYIDSIGGAKWKTKHKLIDADEEFSIDYAPRSVSDFMEQKEVESYLQNIYAESHTDNGEAKTRLCIKEQENPKLLEMLNRKIDDFRLYEKVAMYGGIPIHEHNNQNKILEQIFEWWQSKHQN